MRLAKHKAGYEEVSKELANLRSAHLPLKADLQRAAAQIDDLNARVRSLDRELATSKSSEEAARAHGAARGRAEQRAAHGRLDADRSCEREARMLRGPRAAAS